ncbi:unnamed protein product [Adineta ricciae]|uniref:Uncharacterized protein n=1 Tax=Adineta ricciae TaxID=249248 RepID=A0A814BYJ7_ADIRI|nr:unnamed protein product [Adineta ricciae]CAF1677963.1 unnamed protein product [Adineta ricciae]
MRKVEQMLTNEQLQYLNEYYLMKKKPTINEVLLICNEWNVKGIGWLVDIENWFFGHRALELEIQQRLRLARKAAA